MQFFVQLPILGVLVQLIERLICIQKVVGLNPANSTKFLILKTSQLNRDVFLYENQINLIWWNILVIIFLEQLLIINKIFRGKSNFKKTDNKKPHLLTCIEEWERADTKCIIKEKLELVISYTDKYIITYFFKQMLFFDYFFKIFKLQRWNQKIDNKKSNCKPMHGLELVKSQFLSIFQVASEELSEKLYNYIFLAYISYNIILS